MSWAMCYDLCMSTSDRMRAKWDARERKRGRGRFDSSDDSARRLALLLLEKDWKRRRRAGKAAG